MPPLRFEIFSPTDESWLPIAELNQGDPPGSLSDNHDNGRDVYIFGVYPEVNRGFVARSEAGLDEADSMFRLIDNEKFEVVADLGPNESHQMTVKTDRSPAARIVKFTFIET